MLIFDFLLSKLTIWLLIVDTSFEFECLKPFKPQIMNKYTNVKMIVGTKIKNDKKISKNIFDWSIINK